MAKRGEKKITVNVSNQEFENLEDYCEDTQQTKTSVIRGFLRDLPTSKKEK